ncbi:MAG TPA: hypothetical protein VMB34_28470 [Acetobacteraceae bacterium]|nr:hypothetical protein [Acetobacteraceae bacterium]
MRPFSFAIGRAVNLTPPVDSGGPQPSVVPNAAPERLRRRLQDAVEDVFHIALRRGDLNCADDLLGVMESMDFRGRVRFQCQRKSSRLMIERIRAELSARKARQSASVR